MKTQEDLRHLLRRIDGSGYKAYKDWQGQYAMTILPFYRLRSGRPFVSPAACACACATGFRNGPAGTAAGRVALRDFLYLPVCLLHPPFCQRQWAAAKRSGVHRPARAGDSGTDGGSAGRGGTGGAHSGGAARFRAA